MCALMRNNKRQKQCPAFCSGIIYGSKKHSKGISLFIKFTTADTKALTFCLADADGEQRALKLCYRLLLFLNLSVL